MSRSGEDDPALLCNGVSFAQTATTWSMGGHRYVSGGYCPLVLPIFVKYLIITPLACGVTLALYEFAVRRVNIIRFLFGMKPLVKAPVAHIQEATAI
jgi:hypothetical protein